MIAPDSRMRSLLHLHVIAEFFILVSGDFPELVLIIAAMNSKCTCVFTVTMIFMKQV